MESTSIISKSVGNWDRAMYMVLGEFFDVYDYVWFISEKVFFNHECCLDNMDSSYAHVDLLAHIDELEVKENEISWSPIEMQLPLPFCHGWLYVCRMTKRALQDIKQYVLTHKTLFSYNYLLPTLGKISNWNMIVTPKEFKTVTLYTRFKFPQEYNKCGFFHPMNHPEHHNMIRAYYEDSSVIRGPQFPVFRPSDFPMVVYRD
jgi:hypothetical protein